MKIKKSVYDAIICNCPQSPKETGGIIGITDGIISCFAFDNQKKEYGIYRPDTKFLNHIISEWQKNNIVFGGIFHSHYPSGDSLSDNDLEYIKAIMLSLKKYYPILYYPIVIPRKEIILYRAEIVHSGLSIEKETLILID